MNNLTYMIGALVFAFLGFEYENIAMFVVSLFLILSTGNNK